MKNKLKIIGLIPARWGSTRFIGKPLAKIAGKSMIKRVYEQAKKSKLLDNVCVVTDDGRIEKECLSNSLDCIFEELDCLTGTDRISHAMKNLKADIYVNIQGDEPLINPDAIDEVLKNMIKNDSVEISNAFTKITEPYKVTDKDVVKVVFDRDLNALFYSRNAIPYPKDSNNIFFQQLGLYAFRKNALKKFLSLKPGKLELVEGVEMLRFVENGIKVKMVEVEDDGLSVDTPKDISYIENFLKKKK